MTERKLPWFKMYPQEFMGDENVQLMGPTELGVYFAMLLHQWKAGAVPDDPKMVARICRGGVDEVREAWELVRPCFEPCEERDGYICQPRLERERQDALERRERARKAGRASGRARQSEQEDERPVEQDVEQDVEQEDEPHGQREGERSRASRARGSEVQRTEEEEETEGTDPTVEANASPSGSALPEPLQGRDLSELRELADTDPDQNGRVTKALVAAWITVQAERPSEAEIGKQGAVAKRLAQSHPPRRLALALYGMSHLFPYSKGEPWDLFDLERKISKAAEAGARAARDGPTVKDRQEGEKYREALDAIGADP